MSPKTKRNDADDPEDDDLEEELEEEEETEEEEEGGEEEEEGPTIEELQDELDKTRIALKKANRESAKRRLEIKQLKGTESKKPEGDNKEGKEAGKLQADLDKAQSELAKAMSENRALKLRSTVRKKAAGMKLPFFSEEALDDATERVFATLDEEYDDEDVTLALKEISKSRPYLFRKPEKQAGGEGGGNGGTDAGKKGGSDVIVTAEDEQEVARRFNLNVKPKE